MAIAGVLAGVRFVVELVGRRLVLAGVELFDFFFRDFFGFSYSVSGKKQGGTGAKGTSCGPILPEKDGYGGSTGYGAGHGPGSAM